MAVLNETCKLVTNLSVSGKYSKPIKVAMLGYKERCKFSPEANRIFLSTR